MGWCRLCGWKATRPRAWRKRDSETAHVTAELTAERGLGAIINIHDVPLAMLFVKRIIGLREGEIVYDGDPDGLTPAQLTGIYGEEDWTSTARRKKKGAAADEDEADDDEDNGEEDEEAPPAKAPRRRTRNSKRAGAK